MNREDSVALFEKCEAAWQDALDAGNNKYEAHEAAKVVWNGWAESLLGEKKDLEENGLWSVLKGAAKDARNAGQNEETQEWLEKASLDFSDLCFRLPGTSSGAAVNADGDEAVSVSPAGVSIDFRGYVFPGPVDFSRSQFVNRVDFSYARFLGDVCFRESQFSSRATFHHTQFFYDVDLFKAQFLNIVDFTSMQFSGVTDFRKTLFRQKTGFSQTQFSGDVTFRLARFEKSADFSEVMFYSDTNFSDTHFSSEVEFVNSVFSGNSKFRQSVFMSHVSFTETQFLKEVDFSAIRGQGAFSLSSASFSGDVPDFHQARFSEPVQLSDTVLPVRSVWQSLSGKEGRTEVNRFELIKQLAITARNHKVMRTAFKGELRARRGLSGNWRKIFSSTWLFSLIYDLAADFGRSVYRPLLLWLLLIPAFASPYMLLATNNVCSSSTGKSLFLAAQNAVLFFSSDRKAEIADAYSCLFGGGQLPEWLGIIGWSHTVLSAILLFLVVLGLRNMLRAK